MTKQTLIQRIVLITAASFFLAGCFHAKEGAWKSTAPAEKQNQPAVSPTVQPTETDEQFESSVTTDVETGMDADLKSIDDDLKQLDEELKGY